MKEQTVGGPSEMSSPSARSDSPQIQKAPTDTGFLQATTAVFAFVSKKWLIVG
jgi:hypothetical protein